MSGENPFEFALREQIAETLRLLGAPQNVVRRSLMDGEDILPEDFEAIATYNDGLRRGLKARLGEESCISLGQS